MDEKLNQIKDFADRCHGNQMRKYSPDRYIVHPTRVMEICKEYTNDISILAAALLHDVLEDTPVSQHEIKEFLSTILTANETSRTLSFVVDLTDVYIKATYPQWNRRVRKDKEVERLSKVSPDAQTIKYADIIDNAPEITEKDRDFARKFLPECRALLKKMPSGNPELYERAQNTIQQCMQQLGLGNRK